MGCGAVLEPPRHFGLPDGLEVLKNNCRQDGNRQGRKSMSEQETHEQHAAETSAAGGADEPVLFAKDLPINIDRFWGDGSRVKLRWPTDAEWMEADRQMKVLTSPAGRGATETRTTGEIEYAEWLARKINANGLELSTDDALEIYDLLSARDVEPAQRRGSREMDIAMTVVGGIETAHRLRVPTKTESRDFGQASVRFKDLRRNIQEASVNSAAFGEFYDKLLIEAEGYASRADIPIIHKVAVIQELRAAIADSTHVEGNAVFFG
jgi:hypothetical protein